MILLLCGVLLLCSCGGGSAAKDSGSNPPASASRTVGLTLATSTEPDGGLRVALSAANAAGLYQMSARLQFDSLAVRPVREAQQGDMPAADAIFYSNARQTDYVPVAWSNRRAEAVSRDAGELFHVEFEVLDPARDPGFRLNPDSEFLILRDNSGQNLQIQLEVRR